MITIKKALNSGSVKDVWGQLESLSLSKILDGQKISRQELYESINLVNTMVMIQDKRLMDYELEPYFDTRENQYDFYYFPVGKYEKSDILQPMQIDKIGKNLTMLYRLYCNKVLERLNKVDSDQDKLIELYIAELKQFKKYVEYFGTIFVIFNNASKTMKFHKHKDIVIDEDFTFRPVWEKNDYLETTSMSMKTWNRSIFIAYSGVIQSSVVESMNLNTPTTGPNFEYLIDHLNEMLSFVTSTREYRDSFKVTFAKLHQDRELAKELSKDEFLKCFQKDMEVLKTIEHKEPFYTFYKDSLRTVYTDSQKLTLMEYIHGLIQKDEIETVQRIFKFCEIDQDQDSAYILLEDLFRADTLEFNRQESLKKLLIPIEKNAGNKLDTFKDCLPVCVKILKQEKVVYKKFDPVNDEEHFEKLMNVMVEFLKENCGEFLKDEKVPLFKMITVVINDALKSLTGNNNCDEQYILELAKTVAFILKQFDSQLKNEFTFNYMKKFYNRVLSLHHFKEKLESDIIHILKPQLYPPTGFLEMMNLISIRNGSHKALTDFKSQTMPQPLTFAPDRLMLNNNSVVWIYLDNCPIWISKEDDPYLMQLANNFASINYRKLLNFIDHPNSMKICFENDKKEKITVLCSFYEFKVLGLFDHTDLVKYSDILSKLSMFQKKAITKSIASLISKKILIQSEDGKFLNFNSAMSSSE